MNPIFCLFLLVLAAGPARAQPQSDEAAERQRIAAARSQAETEFAAQERACYSRFAVNDCIDDARTQRRAVLADLRRQEVALNDAERKRRASEKLRDIEARQSEHAAEQAVKAQSSPKPVTQPRRSPAAEGRNAAVRDEAPTPAPAAPREPAVTPAQAQENARQHEARLKQARKHKAKVNRKAARNREPRQPLPVPP